MAAQSMPTSIAPAAFLMLALASSACAGTPEVPPQWVVGVSGWLAAIDARPDAGVLAHLDSELVALHPSGAERWRVKACASCMPGSINDRWVAAALAADGGAWAVRTEGVAGGIEASLERIGSDGRTVFAVPVAAGAWSNPETRLFAEPDRVVALAVARQALVWQAVGEDGSLLGTHDLPMPDEAFGIRDAHLNADGSLTVVALGQILCSVGCNPFHLSLLRISPDGALAWQHDLNDVDWPAMPIPDGGVLMVSADMTAGQPPMLQRFDPAGQAQAPIALIGVTPDARPTSLSGRVEERWLLRTWLAGVDEDVLWSIGADGQVGASRSDVRESPQALGNGGYLVATSTPSGPRMQVLDGITLQARATLPFGTSGDPSFDYGPWYWQMLDDGTVYGTWLSPGRGFGIARYALPWSVPQDWLFRNGFD